MRKENKKQKPLNIRLPGFFTGDEIGLGDLIKRATSAIGIKPCNACEQRATALNNWVVFNRKNK
jgi:hypothetical protein